MSQFDEDKDDESTFTASGFAATESADISSKQAARKFFKGAYDRLTLEDKTALERAKNAMFEKGPVKDYMSGKTLFRTQKEAKAIHGNEWTHHAAEMDHTDPLKSIHGRHQDDLWNTTEDIKEVANRQSNIRGLSKHNNAAKGAKSNREFAADNAKISNRSKRAAIKVGDRAAEETDAQLSKKSIHNAVQTGHDAGLAGAKCAGLAALTVSGIRNIVAVVRGEKEALDAALDTVKDTAIASGSGYLMGGGLTVLSHHFSKVSSQFVQKLTKSNVTGTAITAVMTVGSTVTRYASGEINTEDFIIELGDKGSGLMSMAGGAFVGQMAIPIPVIGATIGSMIGYALSSAYYQDLVDTLKSAKFAHERRLQIEHECEEAIRAIREYRAEMEAVISRYLSEHILAFQSAFDEMDRAFAVNDVNGFIAGANAITRQLGGQAQFKTMDEFDALMLSAEPFKV